MKVADCMTPEPASLTPDDTLAAAIAIMEETSAPYPSL